MSDVPVPVGWNKEKISCLAEVIMGQSPDSKYYNNDGKGLPLVQGNADCVNRKTKPKIWTTHITKTCDNNYLILSVRAPVGSVAKNTQKICLGRGVCALNAFKINNEFLFQFLISFEKKWLKFAQGSTFTAISAKDVKNLKIILPKSNSEQKKIAEILSTWDRAIETMDNLIDAKCRLKKALMQQLLTGKKRFKEFKNDKWREEKLGNFFYYFSLKNKNNDNLIVLSCTKNNGIMTQQERFGQRIASKDIRRYKIVQKGDLIYDPMLLWDGSISFLKIVPQGVISPAYFTFKLYSKKGIQEYFDQFFQSYYMKEHYKIISRGTNVRRKKAPYEDFLNIKINIPNKKEQERIAVVLSTLDKEIDLLKTQRDSFQSQKKGLMQKLLTGKIRVKI